MSRAEELRTELKAIGIACSNQLVEPCTGAEAAPRLFRRGEQAMTSSVQCPNGLGRAIRRLRGFRTQREMAKAAKLKASAWSEYETGSRVPRGKNLARVVAALGVDGRTLEKEVIEVSSQRLAEAGLPETALPPPATLCSTEERLLHRVDGELAELLELRRLLLFALTQQYPE
jgi:transcriptional regulator with XRE-family HTH domain